MPLIIAPLVWDTSITTGTGTFTISSTAPAQPYRTFNAILSPADSFPYAILHRSLPEWEEGIGVYQGSHQFVRGIVTASSNGGAAVNFTAGLKDVHLTTTSWNTSCGFSTGDLKPTHKTLADHGWMLWQDGTIGDATSGSTLRANADTAPLFELYYNGYAHAECPVTTSAGGATTRAAQGIAATAYAAHCRIALPLGAARSIALYGTGSGITPRTLGSSVGAETETPTIAKTASHLHDEQIIVSQLVGTPAYGYLNNWSADTTHQNTLNTGGGDPLNILDPTTYINMMIKL